MRDNGFVGLLLCFPLSILFIFYSFFLFNIAYPKVRWRREAGSETKGQLKHSPKVRCVKEGGRKLTGWLNKSPKVICMRDWGRESTLWLKEVP